MFLQEYLKEMQEIQLILLDFIDNEKDDDEFNSTKTISLIKNSKEIKSILYLISKIADNHIRSFKFFEKLESILSGIKDQIKQTLSNFEIFDIFKKNKRILLFLFSSQILSMDHTIINVMRTDKYQKYEYPDFFYPEIQNFLYKTPIENVIKLLPKDFDQKRKIGENDSYICELIRKDSVQEFISYVNKTNFNLESTINKSVYETNHYFLKNMNINLIDYAAFFGSIQIFHYLLSNKVKLNKSLIFSAIHGNDAEIIQILETSKLKFSIENALIESIKCHHNNVANYILDNYVSKDESYQNDVIYSFHYYNFWFIKNSNEIEKKIDFVFHYACQYNYFTLVKSFIDEGKINVNKEIIQIEIEI